MTKLKVKKKEKKTLKNQTNLEFLGFLVDFNFACTLFLRRIYTTTVKPLITDTSKEFIKCRILHFLIMECCIYLVF